MEIQFQHEIVDDDSLAVYDRTLNRTHALRGMLAGRPAFLVCGGASLQSLDTSLLRKRGVWSMAVNNVAAHVRTNAFLCADAPSRFHQGIWLDPAVMKFLPFGNFNKSKGTLREKVGEEFRPLCNGRKQLTVRDMPNVWTFSKRHWMSLNDTFFTDSDAAWGNLKDAEKRTKLPRTGCTMLLAIRVMYYLGCRRIYLIGCDFQMKEEEKNYAFAQKTSRRDVNSNNRHYRNLNLWLTKMEKDGVFKRHSLEILNCNPKSGLEAFQFSDYENALKDCVGRIPEGESLDCEGFYH